MALDTDRLLKEIKKIRKAVDKISKDPAPEDVHQLRTRIRRFETFLEAVPSVSGKNEKGAEKLLKKIRKQAGKVRDLDVLTSDLAGLHVKGERECVVQLLEHLGAKRHDAARDLYRITNENAPKVRVRLKKTARIVPALAEEDEDSASRAKTQAAATALRLSKCLDSPGHLNRRNLHPYRLKVKTLRNVLRMAKDETDPQWIEALGRCKDAIGDWHDWEELCATAKHTLDHHPQCKLLGALQSVRDQKFEQALRFAGKIRSRNSKRRHGHGGSTIPSRAVKAASGVAA